MASTPDIMLRANTALFAQKVTRSMDDFFGIQYEIQAKSLSKGFFKSIGTLTVVMHFSGKKLQGDFIITTEEKSAELALRNKGVLSKDVDEKDARNCIVDYFTEILNISSGNTLPELEKKYGILSLAPPCVIFGELRLSQVISGNVDICNGSDLIRCTLSINQSGLSSKS